MNGGWTRFVALGDSTTEGLEDPYPDGRGYRGWADRLAERLDSERPGVLYANLAVRGKLARQVREEQLGPALALEPDLVSVLVGINDTLRRECAVETVAAELDGIHEALRGAGVDVLTFTYPDPVPINPLARTARERLLALNEAIREMAARHGLLVAELDRHPVSSDPRVWHADRLHANPDGHARIARAAADALGLEPDGPPWHEPLPPAAAARRHRVAADHLVWGGRYLAPWLLRRARGRSSGDGIVAKRPELTPVGSATPAAHE